VAHPLTSRVCCGRYESLEPELLPPLWLIYCNSPSDSGKVHSDVRQRWHQGDRTVHEAMARFASFAEKGRCAARQTCQHRALLGNESSSLARRTALQHQTGMLGLCGRAKACTVLGALLLTYPHPPKPLQITECLAAASRTVPSTSETLFLC
jgi:hypothetical protein